MTSRIHPLITRSLRQSFFPSLSLSFSRNTFCIRKNTVGVPRVSRVSIEITDVPYTHFSKEFFTARDSYLCERRPGINNGNMYRNARKTQILNRQRSSSALKREKKFTLITIYLYGQKSRNQCTESSVLSKKHNVRRRAPMIGVG